MNRIVPLLRRLRHPSSFIPRGLTLLALIALGWTAAYVEIMLLLTWPWPTLVMTALIVGFVAGAIVAVQLRGLALEPVQQRMDAYRLADTRTDLDTVGHITPPPRRRGVMYEPTDGEAMPVPEEWALDGSVEPATYPARCECGRPAAAFTESGPRCQVHAHLPCHMCPETAVGWVNRPGGAVALCERHWGPFMDAVQSPVLGYSGSSGGIPTRYIEPDPWTPAKSAELAVLNTERSWRLRDPEAER